MHDDPDARRSGRRERYRARNALRRVTLTLRCFDCGRQPHSSAVAIRASEGVAGFAGLVTCGRIWLCPVCNSKVMARRALEVAAALAWVQQLDDSVILWGSLTARHNSSTPLQHLLDVQRSAWRHIVQSRTWSRTNSAVTLEHVHDGCSSDCERKRDVRLTNRPGRVGYIRASELNIGANGWHPHFHPLIVLQGYTLEDAQLYADEVVRLWVEGVDNAGGDARTEGGQQLRAMRAPDAYRELAAYITKATYQGAPSPLEVVWSQGKNKPGRDRATLPHWSLLERIADVGRSDYQTVDRWTELEDATAGHRMLTWSRGLRLFAGIGLEVDDEVIAAEEVGTADDTVCFITGTGWDDIRDRPALMTTLLDALEVGGWSALQYALDFHQVDYYVLELADA